MVSDCGGLVSVRAGRLGVSIITAVLRQRDRDGNFNVVVHAIPGVWSVGYCQIERSHRLAPRGGRGEVWANCRLRWGVLKSRKTAQKAFSNAADGLAHCL